MFKRILILFLLFFCCRNVNAGNIIKYSEDHFGYIGKYVKIYEDSTKNLDFQEILERKNDFSGSYGDLGYLHIPIG